MTTRPHDTRDGIELLIAAAVELGDGCDHCLTRCQELRREIASYLAQLGDLQAYVERRQAMRARANERASAR
jgi:hypothetical protein